MLYQDADDKILEQDIFLDLNEVERVGSTDQVTSVTQMDRFRGGFSGGEDWRSTRRYLVTQDDDFNNIQSELVEDLGEVNMADGATLVDFVAWAVQNYPAERYALVLSDHGMGWPGGWSDPTASGGGRSNAPIVQALDDHLYMDEIDRALEEIRSQTGIDQLRLYFMVGLPTETLDDVREIPRLVKYLRHRVVKESRGRKAPVIALLTGASRLAAPPCWLRLIFLRMTYG